MGLGKLMPVTRQVRLGRVIVADGNAKRADSGLSPGVAREIVRAVAGIAYGSVEIVIHDGKVVQIERKEKTRFPQNGSSHAGRSSAVSDDA